MRDSHARYTLSLCKLGKYLYYYLTFELVMARDRKSIVLVAVVLVAAVMSVSLVSAADGNNSSAVDGSANETVTAADDTPSDRQGHDGHCDDDNSDGESTIESRNSTGFA